MAVPALVVGLGYSINEAAPVALLAVGIAALVGALDGLRHGTVRYKAAILMSAVGTLFSPIGTNIAEFLSGALLMALFSAVMIVVAIRMFRQAINKRSEGSSTGILDVTKRCMVSPETGKFIWDIKTIFTIGSIGALSGMCTGMLGVGGGFIIVPALRKFSNLGMHSIVSTSLMVIALISIATVGNAVFRGVSFSIDAWLFVTFAVVGMLIGRIVSPRIPPVFLQMAFSVVCAVVAAILVVRAYGTI